MKPNESILMLRNKVLQFYKTYERIIVGMTKFLSVAFLMIIVNNTIGYTPILTKAYMVLALAVLSMVLPAQFIVLLMMVVVSLHILSFNMLLGIGVMVVCVALYTFFVRLYPKESLLIIITMVGFKLNIHYMLPILAGVFGSFASIVAILIGIVAIFSYQALEIIIQNSHLVEQGLEKATELTSIFSNQVIYNQTMLALLSIFFIVFMLVYIIRKQALDYAPYVGVFVGGIMNGIGFALSVLFLDINLNVFFVLLMTILSVILASFVQFVSKAVDYTRSETVQFEDEDNFYYVKIVPKVKLTGTYKRVERVYTRNSSIQTSIDKDNGGA